MTPINALFLCIGNSCRSQMAEGFARKYGSDVMNAWSAGLSPAPIVQPQTIEVMRHKNIDIQEQFPKSVHELDLNSFDVIFNISGTPLRWELRGAVYVWDVVDPMTQSQEVYVKVRDQIEGLVMQYVMALRRQLRQEDVRTQVLRPVMPRPGAVARPVETSRTPPLSLGTQNEGSRSSKRFGFGRIRKPRD